MGILHPEILLLLVPAAVVWWRTRDRAHPTTVVRALVLALVVLALAMPYLSTSAEGRDLVVVVDRSRSMPAGASTGASELVALAEDAREEGDRVAVIGFGSRAAIEMLPTAEGTFDRFEREVRPDGSDLGEALDAALELIPENRHGSILVVSDGEENGRDPVEAARRAFGRGVRIDVRPESRPPTVDLSVERIDLPPEVLVGEPFQFTVWVHADRLTSSGYTLKRRGRTISEGRREFEPGRNRLLFRDVLEEGGIADYSVDLTLEGDRIPENNRGLGAVNAVGARPILVLNDDGAVDTLVHALRASNLAVDVARPEALRLSALALSRWRAVILENVAAGRIGRDGLAALRELVVERGGGLLVTGGKASFGVGGYHLTPVDEVLPVSMELRDEHRTQGVAMAIVMDRSGSMSAPVSGGMTKMDLANLGAVAAIELLSEIDCVAVIAVDERPTVIQPLTPVKIIEPLVERVRSIEAGGGGIYVHTGLDAGGQLLAAAPQVNRHIILFADAADAEEQTMVPKLVAELGQMATTVSVIALGTESDPDAGFLKRVAELGEGDIYFTTDPQELPRMFAQDTMTVARSTFVEEPTPVDLLPGLHGLGRITATEFPTLAGYNLNYLRDGATAGAITQDEYRAPILAFTYRGIGRSAAFCAQIGGSFGGEVVAWPAFGEVFVTLARWLAGQEEPTELFPTVRRDGIEAIVSVEVDPEAPTPPDTSRLVARLRSPGGEWTDHPLERVEEHLFEARVSLDEPGIRLGTVRLADDRFVTLPPISLPYSPEFERRPDPSRGERLLRRLAQETGGEVAPAAHALFRGERRSRTHRVISRELVLAALIALILEIAGRRLALWSSFRIPRSLREFGARLGRSLRGRRRPVAESPPISPDEPVTPPGPRRTGPIVPRTPVRERGGSLTSALDAARRKAGRRTDR